MPTNHNFSEQKRNIQQQQQNRNEKEKEKKKKKKREKKRRKKKREKKREESSGFELGSTCVFCFLFFTNSTAERFVLPQGQTGSHNFDEKDVHPVLCFAPSLSLAG